MSRYAVVNQMSANGCMAGDVVSTHRTLDAAAAAEQKLRRKTRRANGPGAYIPTTIVHIGRGITRNCSVVRHNISIPAQQLDIYEIEELRNIYID